MLFVVRLNCCGVGVMQEFCVLLYFGFGAWVCLCCPGALFGWFDLCWMGLLVFVCA